ncbi:MULTISPECIES: AAA family ATPase [Ramlibacter]|nr:MULTISPECIES: AAA family ATPase [Ramlibacter]MBA2964677.1 AAA family ATPase [Ramlibacter sp. CGMCC 1.13660]
MLNAIERIKGLGVYGDYAPPAGTKKFESSNVIYGWNYSGKTTLSRLFAHLERGTYDGDSSGYSFTFATDTGQVTEANAKDCGHVVRVFNSDFVQENLNFGNAHGRPILLLGSESEAAQKAIAEIAAKRLRINQAATNQQKKSDAAASALSDAKKVAAAGTKSALSLVEIYTATQLDIDLRVTQLGLEEHKLSEQDLEAVTKLARTPDQDALPPMTKISVASSLAEIWREAGLLLVQAPEVAGAIQRLTENPQVANWVERGLALHEHTDKCEFCGNDVAAQRLEQLRSHFSTAQANFKARIETLLARAWASRAAQPLPSARAVYPQFRERFDQAGSKLLAAIADHDQFVNVLEGELAAKRDDLFAPRTLVALSSDPAEGLRKTAEELNSVIREHNGVAEHFKAEKAKAIRRAKLHYAQLFDDKQKLAVKARKQERFKERIAKIRRMGEILDARKRELEAQINQAQKGREEINRRIESLLGAESVQIRVTAVDGEDRFMLVRRDGSVAKRLSEGEKTAIGFAFFLTKLLELPDLSKAIVFIDDPISSLDSNHIFQVAAILREAFFEKNEGAWSTKCKQLFVSTHNFEFLGLLRELPMGDKKNRSYYLVHRKAPGVSVLCDMPLSILRHSSEYHFLFSVIDKFHRAEDKTDLEVLMHLPNAVRRFVELYTYAKYPAGTVDQRAEKLFGAEKGRRILKVLHHFSHGNNVERLVRNNDCMVDIAAVVADLMKLISEQDERHLEALLST